MNVVFFGAGGKSGPAVHNLLVNISSEIIKCKRDINVFLVGYGDNNASELLFERCRLFTIKNPFRKYSFSFLRLIRKASRVFKIDTPLLGSNYIYKKTRRLIKWAEIDHIFVAAGNFAYFPAAIKIAKKHNKKITFLYFDPFTENINAINKKRRLEIEKKWYECANSILIDSDDSFLPFEDSKNKVESFRIPVFEQDSALSPHGPIVYGGVLYGFRNLEKIENLLLRGSDANERIDFYTNAKKLPLIKNVNYHELVSQNEYKNIIKNCKAMIVVGNENVSCIPSKLFEAISLKKPTILINFSNLNLLLGHYPLFFDGDDSLVFKKINNFYKNFDGRIDIFSFFPDRKPQIVRDMIIECASSEKE